MQIYAHEIPHTGFHSVISRIENPENLEGARPGATYLLKEYGPKAHGFSPEHAELIIHNMRAFISVAKSIGVNVMEPHSHTVKPNGHSDRVNIVEIVEEVGPDLRMLISDPTRTTVEDALSLIDGYLGMHQKVWAAGFPISLDPPIANFCIGEMGMVYVDIMPPRRRLDDGGYISEWPTPPDESRAFIESRYFSPQQAQVIYLQILRVATPRGINPNTIRERIGRILGQDALDAITFNQEERHRLLNFPFAEDVDKIRIIAAEQLYDENINEQQFNKIYELTHIVNGGILPSIHDVREACRLITQGKTNIYLRRI